MDVISAFLGGASGAVTEFGDVLLAAVQSVTNLVYDTETNALTIVGAALALAMGVGAVYLIFRMVRGLIKQNDRG